MKTPREILLARHKAVEPKLDAIRQDTVTRLNRGPQAQSEKINFVFWCLGGLSKLWSELVLPSRRIWTGLAAIWIIIFAVNVSLRERSPLQMAHASPSPQMILALRQQEQVLAELIGPVDPHAAEPQKSYVPRPSSQRLPEILTA